jgi:hypothetical protein
VLKQRTVRPQAALTSVHSTALMGVVLELKTVPLIVPPPDLPNLRPLIVPKAPSTPMQKASAYTFVLSSFESKVEA